MNPLPLLSIILPVYNAELTLPGTLAALQRQTYANLEIIAVDDGSTDASGRMLDEAAQLDARIKVYHTENGGVWNARKAGMSAANGEYIGFCDADDTPLPQMYDYLVQKALSVNADIAVCAFQRVDLRNGWILSTEMTKFDDGVHQIPQNPGILPSINTALWNKLFSAPILKNSLEFDYPPRVLEDMMLLCSVYPFCKTVAFVKEPLYQYTVSPGSAMAMVDRQELDHLIGCMRQTRVWIVAHSHDARFRDVFDLMAFIHIGLSVPLRLRCADTKSWGLEVRGILLLLDQYFPGHRNCPYATLRYNLKHRMQNGRIMLALWCKKLGMLLPILKVYRLIRDARKTEIRW